MRNKNIVGIQWHKIKEAKAGDRENKEEKQDKKNIGVQGMMTVEASVIVSIILIIIAVYLFFSFFIIDMSIAKSETLRLADEAAAVWKTDGKLTDGEYIPYQLIKRNKRFLWQKSRTNLSGKAKARLRKRTSARLMVSSLKGCKVNIFGDKIRIRMSLSYVSPILGSKKYAGTAGWKFQCNGKADIGNEEELLRQVASKIAENQS